MARKKAKISGKDEERMKFVMNDPVQHSVFMGTPASTRRGGLLSYVKVNRKSIDTLMESKQKVSVDREVLSLLMEAAEMRQIMWKMTAKGEDIADAGELDAFYESDENEAQDMVKISEEALQKARKAYRGK